MAMMDYGSTVKRNGEIIQWDVFMDMKEAVGFTIDKILVKDKNQFTGEIKKYYKSISDEYFSYIGDEELLVCVYGCAITIISKNRIVKVIDGVEDDDKDFYEFKLNNTNFYIERLDKAKNRYVLKFEYKNNKYEVLYGYGVDAYAGVDGSTTKKEKEFIKNWFNN